MFLTIIFLLLLSFFCAEMLGRSIDHRGASLVSIILMLINTTLCFFLWKEISFGEQIKSIFIEKWIKNSIFPKNTTMLNWFKNQQTIIFSNILAYYQRRLSTAIIFGASMSETAEVQSFLAQLEWIEVEIVVTGALWSLAFGAILVSKGVFSVDIGAAYVCMSTGVMFAYAKAHSLYHMLLFCNKSAKIAGNKHSEKATRLVNTVEQFDCVSIIKSLEWPNLSWILLLCLFIFGFWVWSFYYKTFTNYDFVLKSIFRLVKNILKENLYIKKQQYFRILFHLFIVFLLCNMIGLIPCSFTIISSFVLTFFLALMHFLRINRVAKMEKKVFKNNFTYSLGFARNSIKLTTQFFPKPISHKRFFSSKIEKTTDFESESQQANKNLKLNSIWDKILIAQEKITFWVQKVRNSYWGVFFEYLNFFFISLQFVTIVWITYHVQETKIFVIESPFFIVDEKKIFFTVLFLAITHIIVHFFIRENLQRKNKVAFWDLVGFFLTRFSLWILNLPPLIIAYKYFLGVEILFSRFFFNIRQVLNMEERIYRYNTLFEEYMSLNEKKFTVEQWTAIKTDLDLKKTELLENFQKYNIETATNKIREKIDFLCNLELNKLTSSLNSIANTVSGKTSSTTNWISKSFEYLSGSDAFKYVLIAFAFVGTAFLFDRYVMATNSSQNNGTNIQQPVPQNIQSQDFLGLNSASFLDLESPSIDLTRNTNAQYLEDLAILRAPKPKPLNDVLYNSSPTPPPEIPTSGPEELPLLFFILFLLFKK